MLLKIIHDGFFKLITFRAALSSLLAFLFCILLGPRIIKFLKGRKIGEQIEKRDSERLDQIMYSKKDTPTMGGIFIVSAIVISIILCANFDNRANYILLFVLLSLCLIGAYDDLLKLKKISKTGMPMWIKMGWQVIIGAMAGLAITHLLIAKDGEYATKIYFPLIDYYLDLGKIYPFFVMFVIVSCSNAVNITDGLDGLTAGCLVIASLAYAIIAYIAGRIDFTAYLHIPYIRTSAEMSVFAATTAGACLGFLWFNCYPAQIFMGDAGSLPLGGALGLIACITKQEFLMFLVGGIFVIEVLSSLLQILSFKLFRRRIFLIAPLHHHYQFKGLSETKITLRFWIIAALLALASFAMLKL